MNTRRHHKLIPWAALVIALVAFGLSAAASRSPFERLPHLEDEFAYLFQARLLARGQFVMETPEPGRSYWQPFVVDEAGARFGKYPPGWPLLLALGALAGQPWIVNTLLAALTVALTYRLGRELFGPVTGLIAALLTATSPLLILLSGTLMAHPAATLWGVLFWWAVWRLAGSPHTTHRTPWAIVGGIALGMAANTRPLTAIGLALPVAVAALIITLRGGLALVRNRHNWTYLGNILRTGWMATRIARSGIMLWWRGQAHKVRLTALLLTVAALTGGLTLLHNASATGNPFANLYTLVWEYDRIGFGECCGRSGHTLARGIEHLRDDMALWAADLFGWRVAGVGLSWALPLLGLIALRQRVWAWLLAGVLASLALVHVAYWIGAQTYSARYYAEATPMLAILGAAGVVWLARRTHRAVVDRGLQPLANGLKPAVYGGLLILLALSLIDFTPARLEPLWRFNDVGADDLAALDELRDGRPVLILVTAAESWRTWGTYMALTGPFLDSDVVAARDHGPEERALILARFPDRQVLYLAPEEGLRPHE